MDRFVQCGSTNFYVSVNYKADVIKHYFSNLKATPYRISYFQEDMPLGTAGSLTLMKDKVHSTFFVSNCDIIINEDYSQILKYHQDNKNELTVVAALKNYPIAYGVLYTKEDRRGGVFPVSEKSWIDVGNWNEYFSVINK